MKCQEESEEKYVEKLERSQHIKEDINIGSETKCRQAFQK